MGFKLLRLECDLVEVNQHPTTTQSKLALVAQNLHACVEARHNLLVKGRTGSAEPQVTAHVTRQHMQLMSEWMSKDVSRLLEPV